jgi:hypothetical protein
MHPKVSLNSVVADLFHITSKKTPINSRHNIFEVLAPQCLNECVTLGGIMIKKVLIAVIALTGAIYIGFWATAASHVDPAQYRILADKYAVHIVRDKFGVPHIFGSRDVDAAFGLAYAHAEDDFVTMQDVLLVTRGKLATLHGIDAAKTDYLVQFMGVWDVVEAGYETRIDQQTRDHAQAYADGVNFYASENPSNIAAGLLPVTRIGGSSCLINKTMGSTLYVCRDLNELNMKMLFTMQ